ncbi:MAG: hypothetical protein P4N60_05350 [Verrucomicrobiae bacterium]|nr:hypothetical protein [Verrucomicrobiae bacterium]
MTAPVDAGNGAIFFCRVQPGRPQFAHAALSSCSSTNAGTGLTSIIKPEHSPINLLGKLFFRRQAPWQQRQKMLVVCWTLFVALFVGVVVIGLMFLQNSRH